MKKKKTILSSIKAKIILSVSALTLVICVSISLILYTSASSAMTVNTESSMLALAEESAASVSAKINRYYKELSGLSKNELFHDYVANKEKILALTKYCINEMGYKDIMFADLEGMALDGVDISQREYFLGAIKGENVMSSPVVSTKDGSLSIFIGVPVKNFDGKIIGMLLGGLDGYALCDMTSGIRYAKTGYAFMKDSNGVTIAHTDTAKVLNMDNIFDQAAADPALPPLLELEKKMRSQQFTLADFKTLTKIICAGFIILSILLTYLLSRSLSNPIKNVTVRAMKLADNDFSEDISDRFLKRNDEIGMLAQAFQKLIDRINDTLENIGSAASQVSAGSKQLSDSSTALSQGAAEQASSVEELTTSLEQIAAQTRHNANNATQVSTLSEEMKASAVAGNVQMDDMLGAMEEISQSSGNIAKIIKVIEDIAFQTNILALNAAVEAARAGQHGKGFAVVAEEVRNLAARSSSAAKETTALIEGSAKSVENGSKIAQKTAESLNEILERITEVSSLISEIAVASNEQSNGIDQINQGLEQISQVVQSNSATSEESAASSEELAGQAELLQEQIMQFRLRHGKQQTNIYMSAGKSAINQPSEALLLSQASNIGKY